MTPRRALTGLLVAAALAVPAGAAEPAPQAPLTLGKAVALAVADNPGLEATRLKGRQIQAMLDESRAAFLPWVGASYSFFRSDWPHMIIAQTIDAHTFPEAGYFNFPATNTIYSAILEARMSLWAGGRDRARRSLMTTATEICGTETDMARNALVGEVIEGFYDVLAAAERLAHAEKLVTTVKARRDETGRRFAEGAALRADLADVEARLAEAEAGVVHVSASRGKGLATLAIALGMPAASALTLEDEESSMPEAPADEPAGLAEALKTRPELARARLMTRRYDLGVRIARSELLPRLDAAASIASYRDGNPIPELSRDQKVWYVNVTLSWELFDGGARAARIAKAKAELLEFREVDRKTTLGVELDVRSAYLRVGDARAALAAAEKRLEAARQMRDVRQAQHEAGAATLASALEGEQMLTDALMGRTNASFELRKALAGTARALGLFTGTAGGEPPCCGPARP